MLAIEILKFIAKLIKLFPEDAVLLDFVLQLLFRNLAPRLARPVFLLLRHLLHLLQDRVELLVELLELYLEGLVLALLLLDQLQPDYRASYMSEMRFWYFFMIRLTPSFD